ncbi:DUF3303 domain-containing protein [uncultured Nostoc sp.]|uniref:DUF3303 domain-containing protein n=1 Tax=uncultured Nostoc sp. TaxID=340711 RepID=UPI0035CB4957
MMPEGLQYIDSWVEVNFNRCFQLMECNDLRLLQEWIFQWQDLVEFEINFYRSVQRDSRDSY